ncbi:MAG: glycosyltransferase [Candidatus Micrarchaeota archaeon]|nr:glycosyltransferase [Candidatus Micrarchaeota archaeon]
MNSPLISIVIPTKNSGINLGNCLESIKKQGYGNCEVIIVDGFSTDNTREVAESFGAEYFASSEGLAGARNLGFSKANGSIFVSIDSDMILSPNVLGEIASSIGKYDALIIPEVGIGSDFISRCKDLEKRCYLNDEVAESVRAFRRESFDAVGGYDPNLFFGEDADFNSRIKARFSVGRISARIMHDARHTSLSKDLKKAYIYGHTLRSYLAKKSVQSSKWMAPGNIFFIKHFRKLAREPVEGLGISMIRFAEYSAGLLGYLSSYVFPEKAGMKKDGGK